MVQNKWKNSIGRIGRKNIFFFLSAMLLLLSSCASQPNEINTNNSQSDKPKVKRCATKMVWTTSYGSPSTYYYTYDSHGNLIHEENTSSAYTNYEYDNENNLIRKTSGNKKEGFSTVFTYEYVNGQLSKYTTRYYNGTIDTAIYSYNTSGQLESIESKNTSHKYFYSGDRLEMEMYFNGGDVSKITYSYDGHGNVIEEKWEEVDGISYFRYEYDSENRKIKEKFSGTGSESITEYQYNEKGDLVKEIDTNLNNSHSSTKEYMDFVEFPLD